jgi:hypothetical protein
MTYLMKADSTRRPPGFTLDAPRNRQHHPLTRTHIWRARVLAKVPNRKEAIQTAAEMALIPPALTLVFGAALGWVMRGFRD